MPNSWRKALRLFEESWNIKDSLPEIIESILRKVKLYGFEDKARP